MQYIRREISKHGLGAEMAALSFSVIVIGMLLADVVFAGSDTGRMVRDVVLALIFGGLVTSALLAAGDLNRSNREPDGE